MEDYITHTSATGSQSPQENRPDIFDKECYEAISRTVRCVLTSNAGSYITWEDIQDITQAAAERILVKRNLYDPLKNTTFRTWATRVAHNYAIQLSKMIRRTSLHTVSLAGLLNLADVSDNNDGTTGSRVFSGKNTSSTWAMENLGIIPDEARADHAFTKEDEEKSMTKRIARLQEFMATEFNSGEKLLFEMMRNGLSKNEMMARTGKSGGNIDTSICRLRSKTRRWMKEADYYGTN